MAAAKAALKASRAASGRQPRLTRLAPGQHLETRGVLAGAYRGGDISERALLTHAVLVEGVRPGNDVRTLCSQPVDHMADTYSVYPDYAIDEAPTCQVCLPRWERLQELRMEEMQEEFPDMERNGAHSYNPTVIEYAVQEMFKGRGKSAKAAAAATAKKLNGYSNTFISPVDPVDIDARELEAALWDRMADVSIKAMASYKRGKEDWAVDGTLQQFNQKPSEKERLMALIVQKLGYDPFVNGLTPNARGERATGLMEGEASTGRIRGTSGRFQSSTACDFCGKSCAAEHYSDERACGGGDGPGFYLCGGDACEKSRERLEEREGFDALAQRYAEQRAKNEARASRAEPVYQAPVAKRSSSELARLLGSREGAMLLAVEKGHSMSPWHGDRSECERCGATMTFESGFGASGNAIQRGSKCEMRSNGTMHERMFTLRRGYLLEEQEITGPKGRVYAVDLEYQVFDAETGAPVSDSQRVKGERHGDRLIIGDPHRDTRLFEYKVAIDPTKESKDFWQGFRAAMGDRQWHLDGKSKKYYGQSQYWWDGYNEGQRQKRDPNAGYERNGGMHERATLTPNSEKRYYVWVLLSNDTPKDDEGPYGPYEFLQAKDYARISAKEGAHDRAVSVGLDPQSPSFYIARRYERGTGERIQ